jgi:lipopolysaccharide transport system ATP-binding protein
MEIAGKEGRMILFVSHNLSAVKTLCGRAIVLQNGELVFDGDVLEGVGRYLRRDTTESDLIVWNDREAPSIPSARLMQVGILDGGKQAGTDMCTERPIQVRIRFSVFREARIGTSVLLHNTDGVLVFSSHSNHEPRWHGKDRPPGIYRSICEIPANFLAEGRYSITVKFWEGIGQQGIEEKDVLWFSAHARGLVRGDRPYPQTGAATMPLFRWTSEREE